MPNPEIDEFGKILIREVRDAAVRACDAELKPNAGSPVAARWRNVAGTSCVACARHIIPDCVDETIFHLLRAIDQGVLRLKFVSADGREIDLAQEGMGELSGWFMGSEGWRAVFSGERFVDDFSDLTPSE